MTISPRKERDGITSAATAHRQQVIGDSRELDLSSTPCVRSSNRLWKRYQTTTPRRPMIRDPNKPCETQQEDGNRIDPSDPRDLNPRASVAVSNYGRKCRRSPSPVRASHEGLQKCKALTRQPKISCVKRGEKQTTVPDLKARAADVLNGKRRSIRCDFQPFPITRPFLDIRSRRQLVEDKQNPPLAVLMIPFFQHGQVSSQSPR